MRQIIFLVLAAITAVLTFWLTNVSPEPFFCYGVAFIGYTVAACLALVATIGD